MNAVAPIEPAQLALAMNDPLAGYAHNPHLRGYVVTYGGPETACPGCGRTQWLVGRATAECACCSTALPLPERGLTLELEVPVGRVHRAPPPAVRGGHRRAA
jgi:hypothetical protein